MPNTNTCTYRCALKITMKTFTSRSARYGRSAFKTIIEASPCHPTGRGWLRSRVARPPFGAVATGRRLETLLSHSPMRAINFSEDGKDLVTTSQENTADLWKSYYTQLDEIS